MILSLTRLKRIMTSEIKGFYISYHNFWINVHIFYVEGCFYGYFLITSKPKYCYNESILYTTILRCPIFPCY